ncbi:hypothetical protein ACNQGP_00285 [Flavobacterium sp. GT2N3]|uniref:hypothetical protein n=1 Tax=unclassified Flavobacterium TaxID=196869 RepID=UPI003AAABC06
MKKLFIIALLVVGMASFAQERKARSERAQMEQLTPEQRNQLHLKKMTLELDLNASQQNEMSKIIAEQSAKRETKKAERKETNESVKKQLTSDALFAKKSMMLDEQIVMKKRMKKILTSEQYEKWDDMKGKRHNEMKKRTMHHKERTAALGDKK